MLSQRDCSGGCFIGRDLASRVGGGVVVSGAAVLLGL